ncbi:cytochrome c maturation protein CcmE [Stigmatella aurantiaca]|uniref:Cytochrome C-type biogenesis protein CcmE n=1 Tax=Stigmatella aurantiaca (strain DW4/3-1) TaxID=378806 RepID=Q098A7_STIAD|nr:cytochrome c maturation protein CcmE [Stigmatella aurantiaca]ADO71479.1 Cytochrome C-type biogenesis protein CcmE [Stigmatella aurantiaca DW4/3-1]EAU68075.1 cytochrome C-type biogenesis protein CcmE [Stigmatella aurantiaca DW4/3-1]
MTPLVRNRLIAVAALLVAGAGLAFVAFGNIGENLVYYWSPTEMIGQGERAYGPTIRLGGVVKPGSIEWNEAHTTLQFRVASDHTPESASVLVRSTEVPPQMFRAGIGVVVEGTYDASQVFSSNRLMVNHSNEYRPPKPGEEPRKWQETIEGSTTASAATGAQ